MGVAAGESVEKSRKFSGISYDSLSHKHVGNPEAEVEVTENGDLGGFIYVGGFNINFSEVEIKYVNREGGEVIYGATLEDAKYERDNNPLVLQMVEYTTGICGTISRPNPEFGSLAFTMADDVLDRSTDDLLEGLWNKGEGIVPEGFDDVPDVPATGVPRNTGIASQRPARGSGGES